MTFPTCNGTIFSHFKTTPVNIHLFNKNFVASLFFSLRLLCIKVGWLTSCLRTVEYITTLEGDIAERDRLIDAIRTELGSMKGENVALRQEIDGLKKALLEGRGTPSLPPPAPLPAVSAAVRASTSSPSPPPARSRSPLLTPNTQKDLPTSPRMGSRAFWGGAHSSFGSMPVHTTLVPEWGSILSGKGAAGRKSPALQENINPNLNVSTAAALASLLNANKGNEEKPKEPQITLGGFDAFADTNPFTLKSLDSYVSFLLNLSCHFTYLSI